MFSEAEEINYTLIGGTILVSALTLIIVCSIVLFKIRQRRSLQEKNKMKVEFQNELLHSQLEIQEQTLKNISQEIHDNIGQTLSLAKLNLNTISFQEQNSIEEKVTNSKDLVSKAINDLRSLSKTLNTDAILGAGLMKAIEFELKLVEKAGVFNTEFVVSNHFGKLDPKKELILFRIVQEGLNNVIKHSGANRINISANFIDEALILSIKDNGIGFELSNLENDINTGSGLANMRNRAQLIGGKLDIKTSSGFGTEILITVPTNLK